MVAAVSKAAAAAAARESLPVNLMATQVPTAPLPLPVRLLRTYLCTKLRGRTRLTDFCAHRLKSLQAVPITIADRPTFYVDMRSGVAHEWLRGSPWDACPVEGAEEATARRCVRPGDGVLDIGANIGLYTTLLSSLVGPGGRIWAFEPNEQLLPPLTKTVGGLGNTTLYPYALSDHAGEALLYVPNDHTMGSLADYSGAPDLAAWTEQIRLSEARAVRCELQSIDGMVASGMIQSPNFIKCDVEGAELMVFRGGRQTLDRPEAPIIMFEALEACTKAFGLPRFAAVEFLAELSHARYKFFEIREDGELPPLEQPPDTSPNVLAVPESRADVLAGLGGAFGAGVERRTKAGVNSAIVDCRNRHLSLKTP